MNTVLKKYCKKNIVIHDIALYKNIPAFYRKGITGINRTKLY